MKDFRRLLPKQYENFLDLRRVEASHCNGIICLVNYVDGGILLCNPVIGDFKLLPPDPCFHEFDMVKLTKVGFGYDPIADVYKIVRFCGWYSEDFKAHIYTLGNDAWRDIKLETPETIEQCSLRTAVYEVHCKGFHYWLARDDIIIYTFDMHDEEFFTIRLPDEEYFSTYNTNLSQWNESVVLFCYPYNEWIKRQPIEMWVMNDSFEGENRSRCWTKFLSINFQGGIHKSAITFWKSDELLIKENRKGFFSYNINTKKVRRIHKGDVSRFFAFCYFESLVSVNI